MGTHVPTSTPADTTFAYWANLVDQKLIELFNQVAGFQIDASGNTAGRATYDAEAQGFVYYDSQAGLLYQKMSATSADWSDGLTLTAALQNIVEDTTPELGGDLNAGVNDIYGSGQVRFSGSGAGYEPVRHVSTEAAAGAGPISTLARESASPANNDVLARRAYEGKNDAAEDVIYGATQVEIVDVADGTEDGLYNILVMIAGTLSSVMDFTSAGFRLFGSGVRVSSILDQDDMSSDSATALATQQSIKAYADNNFVKVYTNAYQGDGTTSQAITGVGFQPKYVKIWEAVGTDNTNIDSYMTTDNIVDDNASGGAIEDAGNTLKFRTGRIISLDSDGFTVDDAGSDAHPNQDTIWYNFICYG